MHRVILYVLGLLCLFLTKAYGQETESFENQTKTISGNIEKIVKQEKEKLQIASDSLDLLVRNNEFTSEQAEEIKSDLAEKSAEKINLLVSKEEEKLVELVQNTVNEQIANPEDGNCEEINRTPEYLRRTNLENTLSIGYRGLQKNKGTDGYDFSVGLEAKTRLFKDKSLYYLKYGLDFNMQFEYLHKANKHYVVNGNQTDFVDFSGNLKSNSSFTNYYLRLPLALEFDFSKKGMVNGKEVYRINQGFKFSLGGYFGYNISSRQVLRYSENGRSTTRTVRGDWNVSNFEYGLKATIGYRDFEIYATYGLNPIFRNNSIDERTFSIGITNPFDLLLRPFEKSKK